MIDAFVMLAAEAVHEEETSKTAFYVAAGILAGWAVLLSAFGMRSENWPDKPGPQNAAIGITAVLVVAAMATSIATG